MKRTVIITIVSAATAYVAVKKLAEAKAHDSFVRGLESYFLGKQIDLSQRRERRAEKKAMQRLSTILSGHNVGPVALATDSKAFRNAVYN